MYGNLEKLVGKKVYKYNHITEWRWVLDTTKTYTIFGYKTPEDANDYCPHWLVWDSEGNESDVREFECVICPEKTDDELCTIERYLSDNRCYTDEIYHDNGAILIQVNWGDWKHDHLWLRDLMDYIGYIQISERVTEDNGSDCYSAQHTFIKNN